MLKSLNVAQSGLSASKIAVENVSNNIANENTPGYKKRVVQLSELELIDGRMTGRGVRADEAYRITSQYMYDNMMNENTKTNYYEEISLMVGNIEKMFQETDSSGFSSDFNRFFQSIENLRSNPNSEIYRTTFKTQGRVLVDSLQNLYANIEKQEELTKISLGNNVQKVNNLINEIGAINQQLGRHVVASNDLLDKRDELEKELSKYVDIEVDRSNDEYTLRVGGAIAVRFNTNIREVNLKEEFTSQIDRFSTNPTTGAPQDAIAEKFGTPREGDKISYKLNNEFSVTVEIGSTQYVDDKGNSYDIDIDGDGNADTVDASNYIRAMVAAINSNANISEKVIAYNGNYKLDADGNKVDNFTSDSFLLVESRFEGEKAKFEGRITYEKYENPSYGVSGITPSSVVDTDLSVPVTKQEHIIVNGETFTTTGEDFSALATAMNGSATFTPVTYNAVTEELNVNGTVFSTAGKSYSDLVNDINTEGTYSANVGREIVINGTQFITAGEDFAALAGDINANASFTASYNAGTNELTINGEVFSTTAPTSYRDLATQINASSSFSSHSEVRGDISITVGGTTKTFSVNDTTTYQDLADTINADPDLAAWVTPNGKLIIQDENNVDNILSITENLPTPINIAQHNVETDTLFKNEYQSRMAEDKVYLAVFDSEVNVNSGIIKAQIENLTTFSPNNKIIDYKNKLDNFARAISDMYDKYVKTGTDEYIYGHVATDEYSGTQNVKNLNLFSGSDVKTFKFNEEAVNDLLQSDLDYMGTIQWKKDIEFDGFAQDGSNKDSTSFTEFFQDIRVNISSDKENNDFLLEAQEAVEQSLQHTYDKLTKVDNDEEMINLIKFQAAYTANAKIITVVDEMLNTILGIR